MWRLQEMSCLKINTSRAYIHQYQNLKRNYMFEYMYNIMGMSCSKIAVVFWDSDKIVV